MLKVVHVHVNPNFIDDKDRFDESQFDNTVIVIRPNAYGGPYSDEAIHLSTGRRDLNKAVQVCSDADLVVLYALGIIKSYIAIKLPRDVTVAWRFFGYELYVKQKADYLSEKSLALLCNDKAPRSRKVEDSLSKLQRAMRGQASAYGLFADALRKVTPETVWNFLSLLKSRIKYGAWRGRLLKDATDRIDLFLCLSSYEYMYLVQHWSYLPAFVQLPLRLNIRKRDPTSRKDNKVIIGNSKSPFNNHLDIIDLIDELDPGEEPSFVIPFSYGSEGVYSDAVRNRVAESPKAFRLLEKFLPKEQYFDLITGAKAAVFNCYRQMAMGNIFPLLSSGVKVYLNTRNVVYHWLASLGLHVYTIEDFVVDLESENLELSAAQKLANAATWKQLEAEYNRERFANDLVGFVEKKRSEIRC